MMRLCKKYYEAHKKDYLIPQAVKLEYVALNIKDLADKQTVSAEEVQKAYDSKSVDLSPRAEIAHIFIPVMPNGDEASNAEIKAEVDKMAAELKAHPDAFARTGGQVLQRFVQQQQRRQFGLPEQKRRQRLWT